jgi:hypothetical protein
VTGVELLVRKVLATKVNTQIVLTGIFGGLHFPKGGNFIGRTLLLTDVKTYPNGENVSGHLWAQSKEYLQYEKYKKGDILKVVGTVIKYFKYENKKKPKKDFSVKITSCERIGTGNDMYADSYNMVEV